MIASRDYIIYADQTRIGFSYNFLRIYLIFRIFVQAVGAKSRGPNNQNASCTHRAREAARYLANRGHIGIRSTMNNKLNANNQQQQQ